MAKKEDNLIPGGHKLTLEEQSNGGKRSGEVRREKATMKKTLELLLDEIAKVDGNEEKLTYKQMSTLGLIKGAMEGKAENYKTMLALLGELEEQQNETPSVNINIVDNSNLEKTLYEEK